MIIQLHNDDHFCLHVLNYSKTSNAEHAVHADRNVSRDMVSLNTISYKRL